MRRLGWIVLAFAGLYAILLIALAIVMRQPPAAFAKVMSKMPGPMFLVLPFESFWMSARAGQLQPGDSAPAFSLSTLDRKSVVSLAAHRGTRPVVLIFGSYT